jgi:branched-chain amino acid transport system ATP-binding protein
VNEHILETQDMSKEFRGFLAVKSVNLKIKRGHIHGLIGPNGAGKSTVFNLVTRFHPVSSGKIIYDGRDVTHEKPAALSRAGMVRSFQISAVFPHMTLRDNVRVALQRASGYAYSFWTSAAKLAEFDDRALDLLDQVGLRQYADTMTVELAYGRKRALELATTLALEPKLMLLDEPTQGMGHEDVGRITELIKKFSTGRTIVMVEHNLNVVSRLCDRITVLQRGAILTEGNYEEVSSDPRVREAYMGGQSHAA